MAPIVGSFNIPDGSNPLPSQDAARNSVHKGKELLWERQYYGWHPYVLDQKDLARLGKLGDHTAITHRERAALKQELGDDYQAYLDSTQGSGARQGTLPFPSGWTPPKTWWRTNTPYLTPEHATDLRASVEVARTYEGGAMPPFTRSMRDLRLNMPLVQRETGASTNVQQTGPANAPTQTATSSTRRRAEPTPRTNEPAPTIGPALQSDSLWDEIPSNAADLAPLRSTQDPDDESYLPQVEYYPSPTYRTLRPVPQMAPTIMYGPLAEHYNSSQSASRGFGYGASYGQTHTARSAYHDGFQQTRTQQPLNQQLQGAYTEPHGDSHGPYEMLTNDPTAYNRTNWDNVSHPPSPLAAQNPAHPVWFDPWLEEHQRPGYYGSVEVEQRQQRRRRRVKTDGAADDTPPVRPRFVERDVLRDFVRNNPRGATEDGRPLSAEEVEQDRANEAAIEVAFPEPTYDDDGLGGPWPIDPKLIASRQEEEEWESYDEEGEEREEGGE